MYCGAPIAVDCFRVACPIVNGWEKQK
jgi:hypothetical protein